ncbi:hypothetical protein HPB52_010195 [Rhipicephalus sanguineus]|uniref:PDZ domain-containing protein n=1 Tax=Rhipicephalus sanguineus TaxID=34632 RepID=A0A9D4PVP2_RHISA|nr:hypothetical protein HPB52_010195 [Rhipicephalus sanguineus]
MSSSSRSNKKADGGKADAAKKGPSSTVKKSASSSSVTPAPPVRLCKLVRRPDFDGYGFGVLVDEKCKLATVTTVEKGGPAEAGGLRAKDCIVQVNGESVIGASQRDVVDRIKSSTNEVRLLVTNKETVALYKERGISFSSDMSSVIRPSSAASTPLKDKKTKAKDKSSMPPSPMLSRRGSLVMSIEEPSGSDESQEFMLPRGKEAKAAKPTRPSAKNAKPLASLGPAATMSEQEQNLLQRHKEARTAAEKYTEQDRGSAREPSNDRSGHIEVPENPLNQPSTTRGRRSGNNRRPQVRWLSVRSPESIGSPPISYSSQGNDYEAYVEGYMADAEDQFGWPSEGYYSAAPVPFSTSYGAHPAFPSHYEVLPSDPYNVLAAYHPQDFCWPQMAPYQGALMPVMSGPSYGYPSTYAPGYSDFFALYPGYASYEPLQQASASFDRRERQRTYTTVIEDVAGSAGETTCLVTASAPRGRLRLLEDVDSADGSSLSTPDCSAQEVAKTIRSSMHGTVLRHN